MSPDLVERLRAALDQAQHLAEQATPGPWWFDESEDCWRLHGQAPTVPAANWQILKAPKHSTPYAEYWPKPADAAHIVGWSPARVLKLIERDRALLAEFEEAERYYTANVSAPAGELHGLRTAVSGAAAFWLGGTE